MSKTVNQPSVDVVIPVYNEEEALPGCIAILHRFLRENMSQPWTIIIADNGSNDRTMQVAASLTTSYDRVKVIHLDQKGRGRALRKLMLESDADIISYMDVDLSTGLGAFPPMIRAIEEGHEIAIGSRLMRGAKVTRCFKRELTSRIYNLMIKLMFFTTFHDAQCGFKAIRRDIARRLVPLIENQNWFFDTELLLLATRAGYRIKEIPVIWREDPGTTVNVAKTAKEDIKGLLRLRFCPGAGVKDLKK